MKNYNNSICIQNISFDCFKDSEKLFVIRTSHKNIIRYSTNTYFNIFHCSRWNELTCCSNYSLTVICRGKGSLYLFGCNRKKTNYDIEEQSVVDFCDVKTDIKFQWNVDFCYNYDFYYLVWENNKDSDLYIEKAYYAIPRKYFKRKINIAIVSTTYNRVNDIKCLINTYFEACIDNENFKNSSHFFIVNNKYSDKNNFCLDAVDNITVVNNKKNFGGSGGFAQGARLAIQRGVFTHILFMDDDARVNKESWFRTLALLQCMSENLYELPISGSMFTREQPTYCHAIQEVLDKHLHRRCLNGEVFLDDTEKCINILASAHELCKSIRKSDTITFHPYAAWWYCTFPVYTFIKYGYPAPYFFCGDDMEFGLRIKKSPLFFNGICVWHPSFKNKKSNLREYLSVRNYALRCYDYMHNWKFEILKIVYRKIARCLAANDYERGALTIKALYDSMNLKNFSCDGESLICYANSIQSNWKNKKEKARYKYKYVSKKSLCYNVVPMIFVYLTLGGALIPSFMKRKYTVAEFLQVGGRWASQYTACPGEKFVFKFQTIKSIKLSIITFFLFIKIIIK